MFPVPFLTVTTPSATVHSAGASDLLTDAHSSKLVPSNRTTASAGGAALFAAPGVTILGSGSQTSVAFGSFISWAYAAFALRVTKATIRSFFMIVFSLFIASRLYQTL